VCCTAFLGDDLNLINRNNAKEKVIHNRVKSWFDRNPSGLNNWEDCSGFVKAVQKELFLRPLDGDANSIFEGVD
jgi:hypothetical protein